MRLPVRPQQDLSDQKRNRLSGVFYHRLNDNNQTCLEFIARMSKTSDQNQSSLAVQSMTRCIFERLSGLILSSFQLMIAITSDNFAQNMNRVTRYHSAASLSLQLKTGSFLLAAILVLSLLTGLAFAAETKVGRWYRATGGGTTTLSSVVTPDMVQRGYDVLDRNLNVVRRVPPYQASQYERNRARYEAIEKQRQADLNLQRSYISSSYTTAMMQRQINANNEAITYLVKQQAAQQKVVNTQIAAAAQLERAGKTIPSKQINDLVASQRQLAQIKRVILFRQQQNQQIQTQFMPIITRLRYIEANPQILRPARPPQR